MPKEPDTELFQRTAREKARTPRAANNISGRKRITVEIDRDAIRNALARHCGNQMPDESIFDELCKQIAPLRRAFYDTQEARNNPDPFQNKLRAAFAAGQEQLAAMGPITGLTYSRGRRIAYPTTFWGDPKAEALRRDLSALSALIPNDGPRDWQEVLLPLIIAVDEVLHSLKCHNHKLRIDIVTALVPEVSGERPTTEAVRKAIERMNKRR